MKHLGGCSPGEGGVSREKAFYEGQGQRAQVEYLSAQTQEALASAKKNQMAAKLEQMKQDSFGRLAESALATGLAKTPEEAEAYANYQISGVADLAQSVTARGGLQEQGFRDTLSNPSLPLADRLGASSGIKGEPVSPYVNIPEESVNALVPDIGMGPPKVLQTPKGVASAAKIAVSAREPSPYIIDPVTGEATYRRGGKADPTVIAAAAEARVTGKGMGERKLDLPQARARFASNNQKQDAVIGKVDEIAADSDIWKAVGVFKTLAEIPGTAGVRVRSAIEELQSRLVVQAISDARQLSRAGGAYGNTNLREWVDIGRSLGNVNTGMAPKDFLRVVGDISTRAKQSKQIIGDAFYETYPELSENTAGSSSPSPVVKWTRDASGRPVRAQ